MPKRKPYKYLGPWLRKIRVSAGIERKEVASRLSRSVEDVRCLELGNRGLPGIPTIRAWLRVLGAEDRLEEAVKLYMVDGDKLEVSIAQLDLTERLRLIAIYNQLADKKVDQELIDAIDAALFPDLVAVVKSKNHGFNSKQGDTAIRTVFTYDYQQQQLVGIKEYTKDQMDEYKQQTKREEGRT